MVSGQELRLFVGMSLPFSTDFKSNQPENLGLEIRGVFNEKVPTLTSNSGCFIRTQI